jgi:tRNA A-37 threonylcarbamoyl transferase component Bud32
MTAPHAQHPSPADLAAFAAGQLADADARAVAAHLESCPDCRRAAAAPGPSSGTHVRGAPPARPRSGTKLPGGPAPAHAPAGPPPGLPPELAHHPRYLILRELGRGGMGVVYQARQTVMDRPVVIKVISQSLLDRPDALERFRREVRAAAQLAHPNIVTAYDAEQAGDLHFLVMEFVEGQSLDQVLRRKGPLPVTHACAYVRQAALGLQHAFEKGMVHRDIKPQNLMLTPKGQVKILDFGLAKVVSENRPQQALTAMNSYMGTPEYSAPEQATDPRSADIRADVYSLGCTLYCLLAGHPPFQEDTAVKTILAHLQQEPRPLPELRPEVAPELWQVVARLLAKDPARRYQTPAEVAQALAPFSKPGTKTAPPAAPAGQRTALPPAKGGRATAAGPPSNELVEGAARPTGPADMRSGASRGKRWLLGGGLAAGALLVALGAVLAGALLLRVRAPEGVVALQLDPPDAEVAVDGRRIDVSPRGDGGPLEIRLAPGARHLEVRKSGFKAEARELTLTDGQRQALLIRLGPLAAAAPVAVPPPVTVVPPSTTPVPAPGPTTAPAPPSPPAEPAPPDSRADGFVPLFNGKDLDGWSVESGNPAQWAVEGDALVGTSPDPRQRNYLLTRRDYGDFTLRLQFLLEPDSFGAVALRAVAGENLGAENLPDHPLIGLLDPVKFKPPAPLTGSAFWVLNAGPQDRRTDPTKALALPTGAWHSLEVTMQADRCVVTLDGTQVQDLRRGSRAASKVIPALERAGGKIGFKAQVGTIRFRNIAIKELSPAPPAEPAPPEKPPAVTGHLPPAEGFVPLFNGKDLRGWKVLGGGTGEWRVEDGAIVSAGPHSYLFSEQGNFGNVHVRAEVKINDGGNSGLFFRAPYAPGVPHGYEAQIDSTHRDPVRTGSLHPGFNPKLTPAERQKVVVSDMLVRPGEWFTLEVIAFDSHLVIKVNGRKTVDYVDPLGLHVLGHVALQQLEPTTVVTVRKIEVKELDNDPTAAAAAPAGEVDPTRAALNKAWAAYNAEMDRDRQAVEDLFAKREEEARAAGKKALVDQIKADREAFAKRGERPPAAPAALRQQYTAARTALESALADAVKDCTKAKKDAEAAALEAEWKALRRENLFPAGQYHAAYRNNVRATTELRPDYTFHRVRGDNVENVGGFEFNGSALTLKCKDFVEVWVPTNGRVVVEYWAPPGHYPNRRPDVVGEARRLRD